MRFGARCRIIAQNAFSAQSGAIRQRAGKRQKGRALCEIARLTFVASGYIKILYVLGPVSAETHKLHFSVKKWDDPPNSLEAPKGSAGGRREAELVRLCVSTHRNFISRIFPFTGKFGIPMFRVGVGVPESLDVSPPAFRASEFRRIAKWNGGR